MSELVVFWIPAFAGMTILFTGCQSVPKQSGVYKESQQDVVQALETVTQGLTNSEISKEDLKRLAVQVQKDPQAKTALQAVNTAFKVEDTGVKYCPIDGKRFSLRVDVCPVHKVKLLVVE